jgi:16S rRNA (cytidine1402-2'-O)-methyltransferase
MTEVDVETGELRASPPGLAGKALAGTLYVVATPIGNLRDLSFRALDILASVDVIGAEDTRVTSVLLRHFGIQARPTSIREHNEARRSEEVLSWLQAGKSVALVSDAGTPAISDPGARLVAAVRSAGLPVVPIPGANAAAAAVSAAGLSAEHFLFLGFLPVAAKARRELLESVAGLSAALVCYEAPHRVRSTVADLAAACGAGREIVIAREITKRFETIARLPLAGAARWFDDEPNRERGEFVLLVDVAGEADAPRRSATAETTKLLRALLEELPPARAARVAAKATGLSREELYAQALMLKGVTDA